MTVVRIKVNGHRHFIFRNWERSGSTKGDLSDNTIQDIREMASRYKNDTPSQIYRKLIAKCANNNDDCKYNAEVLAKIIYRYYRTIDVKT